ncbi:hypothetical protein [Endozoicomonas euniceicola]|uniref:Uncharacterized protein n=1 Tax=Endozoicomonas euniceicola TaxID=1234143 RepID=A0ABY6GV01_9GAMM|nr:hypothetical protein [Endozoicomonas euniceicola]UYM16595.1 hypothetical protein NX720_01295 [Endozoicomonas euniceicola]
MMNKFLFTLFFTLFFSLSLFVEADIKLKPEENFKLTELNLSEHDLNEIKKLIKSECSISKLDRIVIFTAYGAITGGLCKLFSSASNNPMMNINQYSLYLQTIGFLANQASQGNISNEFKDNIVTSLESIVVLVIGLGAIYSGVNAFAVGSFYGGLAGMIFGIFYIWDEI